MVALGLLLKWIPLYGPFCLVFVVSWWIPAHSWQQMDCMIPDWWAGWIGIHMADPKIEEATGNPHILDTGSPHYVHSDDLDRIQVVEGEDDTSWTRFPQGINVNCVRWNQFGSLRVKNLWKRLLKQWLYPVAPSYGPQRSSLALQWRVGENRSFRWKFLAVLEIKFFRAHTGSFFWHLALGAGDIRIYGVFSVWSDPTDQNLHLYGHSSVH